MTICAPSLLAALMVVSPASAAIAQERASATLRLCEAQTVCNAVGACVSEAYSTQVIELRTMDVGTGKSTTQHLFSGPLLDRAGAGSGMFHRSEWTVVHPANVPSNVSDLLRAPSLPSADHVWVFPDGGQSGGVSTLYFVRPAREVRGLRGDRVVTEFTCRQALF